jgi:hypothetical protein
MGSAAQNSSGASLAAAGFSAFGDIVSSRGVAGSDTFRAAELEQTAQRNKVAAVQTGASETEQLAAHLGNVDAVRAAAKTDPTSPTGAALRDWTEQIGLTKKSIDVDQLMAQSRQEQSGATFLRASAKTALLSGYLNAGADTLKALAPALGPQGALAFLGA